MAVPIRTQSGFNAGVSRILFEARYVHDEYSSGYDISGDGGRFLMVKTPDESAPRQINVILNWFDEVRRRVAAAWQN